MYTQEEYLYGWLLYLLGVAMLMFCGWVLTAKINKKEVRHLLRVSAAALLITPWYASAELDALAPAWIIAGFEGVFEGGAAFWRAGGPLLISLSTALILSIVVHLVMRARGR